MGADVSSPYLGGGVGLDLARAIFLQPARWACRLEPRIDHRKGSVAKDYAKECFGVNL